ncbi:hypothetical protein H310_08341 [Aphanomyces invadans]|uniref:CCHC-type domain-containing protein n=1 Tax=Aphanomyces invadans TaxID=157072 RepID=A0A024TXG1_9STRA|nr:hypothetical protein H310_08341 [Aphanomyces invadans]ETV98840.1 hypothetical protein H310_08341 [Aphanomyces invadans]|eukprot:XP_008872268.1 hypothetical protein H310_08341 [Aphanomyces invadans]
MGKNKTLEVKNFKKTERAAVASGKEIKRNKNVLKRKESSQVEKAQLAETQSQLAANQRLMQQQPLPVAHQRDPERRVEGLSMPSYHGNLNESIGLYIHRVRTFFTAKSLVYANDSEIETRCLAMVVANLKGQAAAWYQELASREGGSKITTFVEFEEALREEFEPDDLQERLRDKLFGLHQRTCKDIMMYVEQFRRLCTDIKQMSELDKVTFFIGGLKLKTREEDKYRQCKTLTAAMKVALEYERAHAESLGISVQGKRNRWSRFEEEHSRSLPKRRELQESIDMEVDNLNVRETSKRKDRSKIRCYNCQKLGHYSSECQKPKTMISSQEPHTRQVNLEFHEESTTNDDLENISLGNFKTADGKAQAEAQCKTIRAADQRFMIKPGVMNGNAVNVMIDSGATTSLCRVGMGSCVVREKTVRIAGYDNVVSDPTRTREVK